MSWILKPLQLLANPGFPSAAEICIMMPGFLEPSIDTCMTRFERMLEKIENPVTDHRPKSAWTNVVDETSDHGLSRCLLINRGVCCR